MAAYVVFVREEMIDAEEMKIYGAKAAQSVAGHAMTPKAFYGKVTLKEGGPVDGAVIVEFPSVQEAEDWYNSPAYQEAREHRFKGANYTIFIIEGV